MKQIAFAFATLLVAAGPNAERAFTAPAADQAATVNITVHYTGQGTVDASHRVWVWLFSSPDIGPGAMPIAQASVDANGAVARFDGVAAERVWIAVAFDEQGVMAGDGPPPSGTPVGVYLGGDGVPKGVVPGETVELTFDDSQRMP
jgi:hypothetical protein